MWCLSTLHFIMTLLPPRSTLFPYTTLFRSRIVRKHADDIHLVEVLEGVVLEIGQLAADHEMKQLRLRGIVWHGGSSDRKSTRLNSSHMSISYAVFCLKKKSARRACMSHRVR